MKNTKFSYSIMAVVLSSALASGTVLAEDTMSDKASMMSSKAENTAERTGDKLDHAADKAGNLAERTGDKAEQLADRTGEKMDNATGKADNFMDDSIITTKVKAELLSNDAIESGDISVETEKGVVTLSGFVASQDQVQHALNVTEKVEGVQSVSDKLNVKGEDDQSLKEYADDAMITSAVKAKLLTDDVVPSLGVSVETQDGVVQLTGEVENDGQATQAENVAKGIDGVKSVKNDLKVKQ